MARAKEEMKNCVWLGFAERVAISVSGIWGHLTFQITRCPQFGGICSWTASDHAGHYIGKA